MASSPAPVRRAGTQELDPATLDELRALLDAAFEGGFDDNDFDHGLGGTHLLVEADRHPLAHASVVSRRLYVADRVLRCGYVESVATQPSHQGRGLGRAVMGAAADVVRSGFEIGALSTGVPGFYEKLGWRLWLGPVHVVVDGAWVPADDCVMVLDVGTEPIDVRAPIAVDRRAGDSW